MYIIEINENGFWKYFYSFDDLETAIEFCFIMKHKHKKNRYRIIVVKGVY